MQQERYWHRSRAISSRVDSHLCAESLGPHPGRRHWPTAASFLVAYFIPRCHVITWPLRDRFQPITGSYNRNFLGSLEFSIRRTCPNHRMRVPRTIWSNLLDYFWTPKIRCRTSLLLKRCFQEKCPIERKHLWSNTWRRCTSSEGNAHDSHPYKRVGRIVALYTLPYFHYLLRTVNLSTVFIMKKIRPKNIHFAKFSSNIGNLNVITFKIITKKLFPLLSPILETWICIHAFGSLHFEFPSHCPLWCGILSSNYHLLVNNKVGKLCLFVKKKHVNIINEPNC